MKNSIIYIVLFLLPTLFLKAEEPSNERFTLWLDLYRGEPVRFVEMMNDLKEIPIIYVGETHTLTRHHQLQRIILQALIDLEKPIVLCLEQIEAKDQDPVDRFNNKEISFDELAKAIQWKEQWSNYADYKELLELANVRGIPVLALNADAKIIRKVGRKGLDALEAEEREQLPKNIFLDDPPYRKLMDQIMMVHAAFTEDMLGNIFQAQVSRDEMMAKRVTDYLKAAKDKNTVALVITGSGHISRGFGIPTRVRRRLPDYKDRIILSTVSEDLVLSEESKAQMREISITHEDLKAFEVPVADYLQIRSLSHKTEEAK